MRLPAIHSSFEDRLGRTLPLLCAIGAGAFMLFGIAIRLRAYLADPPLFIDEALLAHNLLVRSWSELWQPLDLGQTAAPLFLTTAKALASTLGYGEHVLRAVPLVAGCLLLPLAWVVCRQLAEADESMLLVALLAFSPTAIYYDNFFKQYSSDMLASLAIVAVTIRALQRPTMRHIVVVGITGVVSLLFSSTSVFVLAGAGTALVVRNARTKRMLIAVSAIGASWLAVFYFLLRTAYRSLEDPHSSMFRYMHHYWRRDFLSLTPASIRRALAHMFDGVFFALPGDEQFGVRTLVLISLMMVGIAVLARRHDRAVATLFVVPIVLLVMSSGTGRYPLATRLVLFAAPLTGISVATGAGTLLRRTPAVGRIALLGVLLIGPARTGVFLLRHPLEPAPNAHRDLLRAAGSFAPSDSVGIYVPHLELPTFVYYAHVDTGTARHLLQLIDLEGPFTVFPTSETDSREVGSLPPSLSMARIGAATVVVGAPRFAADSGWAEREASRIEAVAACTDVFSEFDDEGVAALRASIESLGGSVTNERHDGTHTSFRACFPPGVRSLPRRSHYDRKP